MNLTNKSTRTSKEDVAVHLGANVTFYYSIDTGKEVPTSVSATAILEGGKTVSASANVVDGKAHPTVTFGNGVSVLQHAQLGEDMMAKCVEILGLEEESE